tara:strand:- start:292 stop:1071 length:780 start_codon:yes stop_codon:yes gene_type:complete
MPIQTDIYFLQSQEVARYETLCRHLLRAPEFQKMFQYMSLPTFELVRISHPTHFASLIAHTRLTFIFLQSGKRRRGEFPGKGLSHPPHTASLVAHTPTDDNFYNRKEILTRHKNLSAAFLSEKYDVFFPAFNQMLETGNYVTRRQSLKLLSELLLDRSNAPSMLKYIGSVENMCLMMNLLRDEGNPTALRRNPNPPDRCYRAYVTVYYTHHKCPVLTTHMFLLHTSQVPCGGPITGDCLRIHVAKHVNQPSSPSSPVFH